MRAWTWYFHSNQDGIVVAAEGVDKSGKGVLRVCFDADVLSLTEAERTLRVPVCALGVMSFRRSDEVLSLLEAVAREHLQQACVNLFFFMISRAFENHAQHEGRCVKKYRRT